MKHVRYTCTDCGTKLSYQSTKHTGCLNCGFLPPHSAD